LFVLPPPNHLNTGIALLLLFTKNFINKKIIHHLKTTRMDISTLKEKPVWQMTGEEFLLLQQQNINNTPSHSVVHAIEKKHVYGIAGIARLFGCSIPTANRIKKSGKIDKAIVQIGRKIIVDANLALELAGRKQGGRK
jgi:hypothetical protein